jgi:regulatory protein
MRITALQTQANDPNRTNIFVDRQFLMGANTLIVLEMKLHVGQELTPVQLAELRQQEESQKAFDRALNYLSSRPHSREEVRRYLRKKETPSELIDGVLERLDRMDLVNDQSFTSFWIEAREHSNPKGMQAIKNELRMKGVQRDLVDEMVNDEQDEELALRAARRKAQSLLHQPDMDFNTFRTRLGAFLQRRGFSYEVTKHALKALWEELKAEDAGEDEDS